MDLVALIVSFAALLIAVSTIAIVITAGGARRGASPDVTYRPGSSLEGEGSDS